MGLTVTYWGRVPHNVFPCVLERDSLELSGFNSFPIDRSWGVRECFSELLHQHHSCVVLGFSIKHHYLKRMLAFSVVRKSFCFSHLSLRIPSSPLFPLFPLQSPSCLFPFYIDIYISLSSVCVCVLVHAWCTHTKSRGGHWVSSSVSLLIPLKESPSPNLKLGR